MQNTKHHDTEAPRHADDILRRTVFSRSIYRQRKLYRTVAQVYHFSFDAISYFELTFSLL